MSEEKKGKGQRGEWGAGRVAFLAKLAVMEGEAEAGRSVVAIYRDHLEGVMSLKQFRRYAKRYLNVGASGPGRKSRGLGPVSGPGSAVSPPPTSSTPAPSSSRPAVVSTSPVPAAVEPAAASGTSESGLDKGTLDNITASKIDLAALALLHHQRSK